MSERTKIQWCDSTVNPVMGCAGCELWNSRRRSCYAGILHDRHRGKKGFALSFDVPETFPGRMSRAARWGPLDFKARPEKPWLDGLPRLIFVSDMGDALSEEVSFQYLLEEIIRQVRTPKGRRHRWLWLTKRGQRLLEFARWAEGKGFQWPMNLWPGVSVTGPGTAARVESLRRIGHPNLVRFVSFEPLLAEPDWDECLRPGAINIDGDMVEIPISWAIFGGESGRYPRPMDVEIMRRGLDACRRFGVAPFVKQLGARPVSISVEGRLSDSHGGDWSEWPEDLRIREMPISPRACSRRGG